MKQNKENNITNKDSIEYKVEKTLENFHETQEMIEETNDEEMKSALEAKNARRIETLKTIKKDVKQEAIARQQEYK